MKKYTEPEIEIVTFSSADIITLSGADDYATWDELEESEW